MNISLSTSMEVGGSMSYSRGLSNNSYPEPSQTNSSH